MKEDNRCLDCDGKGWIDTGEGKFFPIILQCVTCHGTGETCEEQKTR